ncbi:LiaF transmembrane domain-containing protein [Pedobacter sp.]
MKYERIIWGVLLLFVGGVLLLENLNVIEFYWRNVWGFWPIFLIIAGVNLLLNRNGLQTGSIVSLAILIITLAFLFVKGQEKPTSNTWWGFFRDKNIDADVDWDDNVTIDTAISSGNLFHFSEPFVAADSGKKTVLNLSGGGTSFKLENTTDSLFEASVVKRKGEFSLAKTTTDSTNTLTFKMNSTRKNGKNKWSFNAGTSKVNVRLNTQPMWEMNLKLGAGDLNFDLTKYKIRTLNFDGGAADLKIKVGQLLPITDLKIKTGVSNVEISVPKASGCRIKTHTGLASKDFKGFVKKDDGYYETPNFNTSKNKIFINLDGGLASFEVDTY